VHQSSHKLVDEVGRLQPRELERGHAPTVAPEAQYAQIIDRVPAHPKCPTVVTGVEQDLPNHRQHAHSGHDAMVTPRYQSGETQLTKWHRGPSAHRTNLHTLGGQIRTFDAASVGLGLWLLRYGKIARMAQPAPDPGLLLREDLSKEYYALVNLVSNYDGWLLIVKGWSVTLSLTGLGLGFQQRAT
jgi:hypothetical protein